MMTSPRHLRIMTVAAALLAVAINAPAQPATDEAIRPFTIRVPDAVLSDLKTRLASARIPEPLQGDGWALGTDIRYLRQLVDYWRKDFDWRAQERKLNQFEQFTTTIDGLTVHFIHRRSKHANALPLLITHGWPGSIVEFTKIIGPLTDPEAHGGKAADAFHLVIPSIPGFGFSQAPNQPGFDPARIAALQAKLMARLGYARYGVQGGDWGSIISTQIALVDAPRVAGLHINMCFGAAPAGTDPNEGLTDRERERVKQRQIFQAEETGYQQIQGTKPQTLGIALNDSPVGLAAWIVEKFRTWCDCNGNPETVFTKDELLTNITLYWVTQTAASSARIYYESRHAPPSATAARRIEVPTACADFPKEIIWSPRRWLEGRYNITRWTEMPRGGHFAAFEQPQLLVEDVRAFFATLRATTVLALMPNSLSAQRVTRRVFVSAVDAAGAPVLNLTAAEVQVTENGSPREVTRVSLGTAPLRIVLLVDSSTSIGPIINSVRTALNRFVDAVPDEHEVTLISTGGQIRVRTQPTTDRQKVQTEIARFAPDGGANAFLDTLIEADRRFLKTAPGQWPVLVIVTTDNGETRREMPIDDYNRFMNDFVTRAGAAHAVIVRGKQIGPVTDLTLNLVENVAGLYHAINTDITLPDRLEAIAERLVADHQKMADKYEVEFTGDARVPSPMVNVTVTRDGVQLHMSPRRPF